MSTNGDTFTPMSVAVLVKIPPRLAVARAIAIDVVLFAIVAAVREKCTSITRRVDKRTNLRLCPQLGVHGV